MKKKNYSSKSKESSIEVDETISLETKSQVLQSII